MPIVCTVHVGASTIQSLVLDKEGNRSSHLKGKTIKDVSNIFINNYIKSVKDKIHTLPAEWQRLRPQQGMTTPESCRVGKPVATCWKMLRLAMSCNSMTAGRQSPRQSWSWSELRVKSSAFWYLSLIGLKSCNPGCGLVHSWTLDHSSCWITDTLHCCQAGTWCTLMLELFVSNWAALNCAFCRSSSLHGVTASRPAWQLERVARMGMTTCDSAWQIDANGHLSAKHTKKTMRKLRVWMQLMQHATTAWFLDSSKRSK